MANRRNDRDRLFQYSENASNSFNSHATKETKLDMEGAHYDKLAQANASKYIM
jgi:hypothetical protein